MTKATSKEASAGFSLPLHGVAYVVIIKRWFSIAKPINYVIKCVTNESAYIILDGLYAIVKKIKKIRGIYDNAANLGARGRKR